MFQAHQYRDGDLMITVTLETEPAVIPFAAIVAAAKVEDDPYTPAPWEDCDGYEHTATHNPAQVRDDVPSGGSWARPYNPDDAVWCQGSRDRVLIEVSRDQARAWGVYDGSGSKQVNFERGERQRRQTIDQLKTWYADGWTAVWVVIAFKDESASLGGIYLDNNANWETDPDVVATVEDLADEVAAALEKQGYTVTGRPDRAARYRAGRLASAAIRRAFALGFADVAAYDKWLVLRPPLP